MNAVSAEKKVQQQTSMRNGPGAYYDIILSLPKGTTVTTGESNGSWISSRTVSASGWVALSAFEKARYGIDYSSMLADADITVISSADIAAGTKGAFLTAYSEKHNLNSAISAELDSYKLDPRAIIELKQSLTPDVNANLLSQLPRKEYKNSIVLRPDAESLLGQALTAHVAQGGLIHNNSINEYVNAVAAIVGEQTERYDLRYKVGIIDDPQIIGFGLPGGYILLSKGLLASIRNEAELACLLGHEMAHISLFHGLREFQKRDTHRKSDSAFGELDGLTGGSEDDDIENDLNKIADKAYLKIIGERARGDESEADLFGMTYAAMAGYDPNAMITVLERISEHSSGVDSFKHHPPLSERVNALTKAQRTYKISRDGQKQLSERFQSQFTALQGSK